MANSDKVYTPDYILNTEHYDSAGISAPRNSFVRYNLRVGKIFTFASTDDPFAESADPSALEAQDLGDLNRYMATRLLEPAWLLGVEALTETGEVSKDKRLMDTGTVLLHRPIESSARAEHLAEIQYLVDLKLA